MSASAAASPFSLLLTAHYQARTRFHHHISLTQLKAGRSREKPKRTRIELNDYNPILLPDIGIHLAVNALMILSELIMRRHTVGHSV